MTIQAQNILRGLRIGHLIGGRWIPGEGAVDSVVNPADGEHLLDLAGGSEAQVDEAVAAAAAAFPRWSRLIPAQRSALLLKLADRMEREADRLVELEALNCGKPRRFAREDDVGASYDGFRFFAGAVRAMQAQAVNEYLPGHTTLTRRDPVGVIAAIVPWNYPLLMFAYKVAPAIAAGNTVVVKPSELTPLSLLYMAELMGEILPPGVVNVIYGRGSVVGEALARHPQVDMICVTGSIETGKRVMAAASSTVKRTHLELGGKAAAIVLDDASIPMVARGIRAFGCYNAGQDCTAASRVYATPQVYDALVEALHEEISGICYAADDGMNDMPPLISERHRARVAGFVERARALDHVRVLTGPSQSRLPGFHFPPTLIAEARQTDEVVQNEVFGPVVSVTRVDSPEQAIAFANDSRYGLAASIWSRDIGTIMSMIPQLRTGMIWVNHHMIGATEAAHVALKHSGTGVDLSAAALDGYTVPRSVQIRHSLDPTLGLL